MKDCFPLPFLDQVWRRVAEHEYYNFLDGNSGYFKLQNGGLKED